MGWVSLAYFLVFGIVLHLSSSISDFQFLKHLLSPLGVLDFFFSSHSDFFANTVAASSPQPYLKSLTIIVCVVLVYLSSIPLAL